MIRPLGLLLCLLLLAGPTELGAAGLPRSFTVTSFDRIRVEGPYAVALTTGRAPFARAEGSAAALDAIDLRVDGRTLVIRQRSGFRGASAIPVRISVGTPDLRSASLIGAGSLSIDRLRGLSLDLGLAGPGSLRVGAIEADRLNAAVQGSGALVLAGRAKVAILSAKGTPVLDASGLQSGDLTILAEGSGEVSAFAGARANVSVAGTVQVRLSGRPACVLKVSGSAAVEGCAAPR
jgi:hypothetical protein